jgi:hypothetical protein
MTQTFAVRRLAWAGVEIRLGSTRLLIDPLEDATPLAPVMGVPHRPLPPIDTPPGTHALITCGDTQWHGSWWQIARDHGPFDVAFVPVNGVVARFEGYEANVPVTMTPEQAVEAAVALGATTVCAMHYGLFHNPPFYIEQPDIEQRFRRAAGERGLTASVVADGHLVA